MNAPPCFDQQLKKGYLDEKGIRTQKTGTPCGLLADRIDPFALWREVRQAEPSYFIVLR